MPVSPKFICLAKMCLLNFKFIYTSAFLKDPLRCQTVISKSTHVKLNFSSPLVPANPFYWVFSNSHLKGWPILSVAETKLLASFQNFLLSHSYQICWNSCYNILKYGQNPILEISIATTLITSHHYYSNDYYNNLLTGFCFHLSANSFNTTVRVKSKLDHIFSLLRTVY